MPKRPGPHKRPKKVITLTERIQRLADAWEREAKTLGAYLTPEHETDANHPSGHNRAYYRFAGQANAIELLPRSLREELDLCATDEQRLAKLNDFRIDLVATRLASGNYLDDNPESDGNIPVTTRWELEGKVLKLKHLIDAIDDVVKAHKEQRGE